MTGKGHAGRSAHEANEHWGDNHQPPPLFEMRMLVVTTDLDKGQVVQLRIAGTECNLLHRRNNSAGRCDL